MIDKAIEQIKTDFAGKYPVVLVDALINSYLEIKKPSLCLAFSIKFSDATVIYAALAGPLNSRAACSSSKPAIS